MSFCFAVCNAKLYLPHVFVHVQTGSIKEIELKYCPQFPLFYILSAVSSMFYIVHCFLYCLYCLQFLLCYLKRLKSRWHETKTTKKTRIRPKCYCLCYPSKTRVENVSFFINKVNLSRFQLSR